MDVIAGAVTFVEVLAAAQVEQVEFVDQAIAFQEIERAVDGHAVHARVKLLRAVENRVCVQVALGVVHDLEENFSLSGEADAALGQGFLQAAGADVGVDALAGGDSMCGGGHVCVRAAAQRPGLSFRAERGISLRFPRAKRKRDSSLRSE